MDGASWVSSARNLLEKVGDLRGIAILVQSNFGIFDIYWSTLNLVKLSRIVILFFQMGFLLHSFFYKQQFISNKLEI